MQASTIFLAFTNKRRPLILVSNSVCEWRDVQVRTSKHCALSLVIVGNVPHSLRTLLVVLTMVYNTGDMVRVPGIANGHKLLLNFPSRFQANEWVQCITQNFLGTRGAWLYPKQCNSPKLRMGRDLGRDTLNPEIFFWNNKHRTPSMKKGLFTPPLFGNTSGP